MHSLKHTHIHMCTHIVAWIMWIAFSVELNCQNQVLINLDSKHNSNSASKFIKRSKLHDIHQFNELIFLSMICTALNNSNAKISSLCIIIVEFYFFAIACWVESIEISWKSKFAIKLISIRPQRADKHPSSIHGACQYFLVSFTTIC